MSQSAWTNRFYAAVRTDGTNASIAIEFNDRWHGTNNPVDPGSTAKDTWTNTVLFTTNSGTNAVGCGIDTPATFAMRTNIEAFISGYDTNEIQFIWNATNRFEEWLSDIGYEFFEE